MACFTTDHVIENAVYSKSCQVGDDIWLINRKDEWNITMCKFDTKTKTFENFEYNIERSDRLWEDPSFLEDYSIFSSNSKLYMYSHSPFTGHRLLKFDQLTLKWTRVMMDFDCPFTNNQFIMLDRTVYMTPGHKAMTVLNLGYWQTARVEFPRYKRNHEYHNYNICKVNDSLYLIGAWRPGRRSVYQYDKDNSTFVNIKKKDRMLWAFEQYGTKLPDMDTFVWSSNDRIYQAYVVHRKKSSHMERTRGQFLVIDYFDIETEQWHTIFQSKYERNVTNIIGGSDNNVYVISDNLVDFSIREINLDPNLENKSLIQLADKSIANYLTDESLTLKLPLGLRDKYDNMVAWKKKETPLGQLEYIMSLLEKLEVGKAENTKMRAQVNKKINAMKNDPRRVDYMAKRTQLTISWRQMNSAQDIDAVKFVELQKKYDRMLELQRNKMNDEREQQQIQQRAGIFYELFERYESWMKGRDKKIPVFY